VGKRVIMVLVAAGVGYVIYSLTGSSDLSYIGRSLSRVLGSGGVVFLSFGMIHLVYGTLGAGKSYYAVRKCVEAMLNGKMVVTNFRMYPTWVDQ